MSILAGLKWSIGVLSIICIGMLCIGTVSGVMISSPDVVKPGDPISVFVGNLNPDQEVQIDLTGDIKTNAGTNFTFTMRDLIMELELENPNIDGTISGLVSGSPVELLFVNKDGVEITKKFLAKNDGTCNLDGSFPLLEKDEYYSVEINGTPLLSQIHVDQFRIVGKNKIGTNLAKIDFRIWGFSNGVFDVTSRVDGKPVETKQFTVQDQLIAIK
ncbi:hypothetical protein [Methanospirillum hungatei]|uniref:hypothetical protein n=1 Tax=Methanospirillum hungatei TaxID=2203 RepID=UPI0026EB11AC|nr:hypothetical protein [Methanospirillum hungatei]MCA1914988.1 hypothetical protein [Methanospirillum hungatei]